MRKKLFVWFICAVMLVLSIPVMADETNNRQPDYSRTGSITVDIHTSNGTRVPGGTLMAYEVASAVDNELRYTEVFSGCPVSLAKVGTGKNGEPELSKELASYAAQKGIAGKTVAIDGSGRAVFPDLELGLYLIVQETPAKGYQAIAPFSVTVPMWNGKELLYDVYANPKPETAKPVVTPVPPSVVTPVPVVPVVPGNPAPLLPQTGQLWWPVPLLIAAGAVLLLSGLRAEKRRKKTA